MDAAGSSDFLVQRRFDRWLLFHDSGGVIIGFGIIVTTSAWLEPLLFRTNIADPVAFGSAAALSITVSVIASLAPARPSGVQ